MSLRFIYLVLFFSLLAACSRENDVSIPPQQVNSDVDCSIPLFSDDLILGLEGYSKAEDGKIARQYFQSGALSLEDIDSIGSLQNIRSSEPIFNELVLFIDLLDQNSELNLVSNEFGLDKGRLRSVSVTYDGTAKGALPDEVETVVPVSNDVDLKVTLSFVLQIEDSRPQCAYLDESISGDNDSEDAPVIRTKSGRRELFLSLPSVTEASTILEMIPLESSFQSENSEIGAAVAFNGSLLAVGKPGDDSDAQSVMQPDNYVLNGNSIDSGAVYIFGSSNGGWELCSVVKASNGRPFDHFGSALAFRGGRLLVAAPGEDGTSSGVFGGLASSVTQTFNNTDSGALYQYEVGVDCSVTETAYIKSPDNHPLLLSSSAGFGYALDIHKNQLVVSAPRQLVDVSNSEIEVGRVYYYRWNDTGSLEFVSKIDSKVQHEGELFGASLAVNDDFIAVGAPGDSASGLLSGARLGVIKAMDLGSADLRPLLNASGATTLFTLENFLPELLYYFKPEGLDEDDRFGTSVALMENQFFISAPNDDSGFNRWNAQNDGTFDNTANAGAIYHFDTVDQGGVSERVQLKNYIKSRYPAPQAMFGEKIMADRDRLIATNYALTFVDSGAVQVSPVLEVFELDPLEEPIYLSVVEAGSTAPVTGKIKGLDVYGGVVSLGLPDEDFQGVKSGAVVIWE